MALPDTPATSLYEVGHWAQPVRGFQSTRLYGCSKAPYDSFNLGLHVGDNPADVQRNRDRLRSLLPEGTEPVFMQQVHSDKVAVVMDAGSCPVADALVTAEPGLALCVMTADCLPLLLGSTDGQVIAAVHCGWRGLAQNIVGKAIEMMRQFSGAPLQAYLGPAIGPASFEVGAEVRAVFTEQRPAAETAFVPHGEGKYLADLYALCRLQLTECGVHDIEASGYDTFTKKELFFSYRRDKACGRQVSAICKGAGRKKI